MSAEMFSETNAATSTDCVATSHSENAKIIREVASETKEDSVVPEVKENYGAISASKSTTGLSGSTSRIPLPSPTPFRRSLSLRGRRTEKDGSSEFLSKFIDLNKNGDARRMRGGVNQWSGGANHPEAGRDFKLENASYLTGVSCNYRNISNGALQCSNRVLKGPAGNLNLSDRTSDLSGGVLEPSCGASKLPGETSKLSSGIFEYSNPTEETFDFSGEASKHSGEASKLSDEASKLSRCYGPTFKISGQGSKFFDVASKPSSAAPKISGTGNFFHRENRSFKESNRSKSRNPQSSGVSNHHGTRDENRPNVPLRRAGSNLELGRENPSYALSGGTGAAAGGPQSLPPMEVRNRGARSAPNPSERPRTMSLSLTTNSRLNSPKSPSAVTSSPRTPPTTPEVKLLSVLVPDWDTESITSCTSGVSLASSCDHASVARNGTTFSGRSMKYVVHCNQHAGMTGEDYLTPTQRAYRQVKKLKILLQQAHKELEKKDSEIVKLTKEVVELRLYKAALSSPEDKSNSSDLITVRENPAATLQNDQSSPTSDVGDNIVANHIGANVSNSCADSGHFEDFTNSSVHSKDSVQFSDDYRDSPQKIESSDKSTSVDLVSIAANPEHEQLRSEYELRIQELVKVHEEESHQLKQKHNDKVEELLQRISDINTRYWELVPDLEAARERIKELEGKLDEACRKLEEQSDKHKQMYLEMYKQGQEAARLEHEKCVLEAAQQSPSRVSVPELLHQLQVTQNELENIKDIEYTSSCGQPLLSAKEAVSLWVLGARKAMYRQLMEVKSKSKIDPEVTLQFLKSAIYYFLTDKENNQGHLRAIQSILGFSESEINNIDKARMT